MDLVMQLCGQLFAALMKAEEVWAIYTFGRQAMAEKTMIATVMDMQRVCGLYL
jgi:hypothetical protein